MKKNKFVSLVIAAGLVSAVHVSCDKNDGDPQPQPIKPGPDDVVAEAFEQELDELRQTLSVTVTPNGAIVTGEEGTRIRFSPGSLTKSDGSAVSGPITVELIEIYDKANMLLSDMPTKGRNQDGDIATLISGGEFYVNAKQNGEQLVLNGFYEIAAPVENTGEVDQEMGPFIGKEECDDDDCDIVWEEDKQGEFFIRGIDGAQGGTNGQSAYFTFQFQFGWTNIDKWFSDPRPKTTIFVDVPEGYDNTNCAVYLSYDGEPTALAAFDTYDSTTDLFSEHYGLIPIGLNVHFVMVSVIDGQWYYAIKGATITNNHVETFTELQPVTETALRQLINDLP